MKFLQGGMLWKQFQALSMTAKERVWIASPYIGEWNTVRTLLGATWWHDPAVDFRLLTDFDEANNYATLQKLSKRSMLIRSLVGLHAKVYIFDSKVILTSANFTRAGFNKLFEAGFALDESESKDVVSYFQMLWSQSQALTAAQIKRMEEEPEIRRFLDQWTDRALADRWLMPPAPPESAFETDAKQSGYMRFVSNFRELASEYETAVGQIWDMPLALEVDAFLNFLFHEHPYKPSAKHYGAGNNVPRLLSPGQRLIEIEIFARQFHKHEALDDQNRLWRLSVYDRLRGLLDRGNIRDLTREEIDEIVGSLHSMNAYHYTLPRFLDPIKRSSPEVVREAWWHLLYGSGSIESRIESCTNAIYGMGENSVQELLGWHSPNRYPIRNSNTDAGMLFFGYSF